MDSRLLRSETGLLVVDVQERLLAAMPPEGAARLVRQTVTLIHTARMLKLPVWCTEQYPKGLGPTVAEIKDALKEAGGAEPQEKHTFSAVGLPSLVPAMAARGCRRVVVTGMEAHVCVYLTARDLVLEGMITAVPHDACLSRRTEDHATALQMIRTAGALVTTTETTLFELLETCTDPAFKELSRRVK